MASGGGWAVARPHGRGAPFPGATHRPVHL